MPYELRIYKHMLNMLSNLQTFQSNGGKLIYNTDILE